MRVLTGMDSTYSPLRTTALVARIDWSMSVPHQRFRCPDKPIDFFRVDRSNDGSRRLGFKIQYTIPLDSPRKVRIGAQFRVHVRPSGKSRDALEGCLVSWLQPHSWCMRFLRVINQRSGFRESSSHDRVGRSGQTDRIQTPPGQF